SRTFHYNSRLTCPRSLTIIIGFLTYHAHPVGYVSVQRLKLDLHDPCSQAEDRWVPMNKQFWLLGRYNYTGSSPPLVLSYGLANPVDKWHVLDLQGTIVIVGVK